MLILLLGVKWTLLPVSGRGSMAHPLQHNGQRRRVVLVGDAEVPLKQALDKNPILYVQRPVQAEGFPQIFPCFLRRVLGHPVAMIGPGNTESAVHSPNEHIFIEDYILGIKMAAAVIDRFAREE